MNCGATHGVILSFLSVWPFLFYIFVSSLGSFCGLNSITLFFNSICRQLLFFRSLSSFIFLHFSRSSLATNHVNGSTPAMLFVHLARHITCAVYVIPLPFRLLVFSYFVLLVVTTLEQECWKLFFNQIHSLFELVTHLRTLSWRSVWPFYYLSRKTGILKAHKTCRLKHRSRSSEMQIQIVDQIQAASFPFSLPLSLTPSSWLFVLKSRKRHNRFV